MRPSSSPEREAAAARPAGPLLRSPVGFLLLPQFTVIALSSAIEPLRIANRYLQQPYAWRLLSLDGGPVPDDNGIAIHAHASWPDAGPLGTLIVCADVHPERHASRTLLAWLRRLDRQGVTLGGIDTGAFVLARAGLLDGHRATVHWEVLEAFRERHPRVEAAPTLFEVDERRLTCAGGTAVLDMMLNAIGIDHGLVLARRVAEHCLHERIRSGASRQRMDVALRSGVRHPLVARALRLIERSDAGARGDRPLADRLGVSVRHLARLFVAELGTTPARLRRQQRLERARELLRHTDRSITEVALATGFESLAHFSRTYRHAYSQPPSAERTPRPRAPRLDMRRTEPMS